MTKKDRVERTLGSTREVVLPTHPDTPWIGVMVTSEQWADIQAEMGLAWSTLERIRDANTCEVGCRCGTCIALLWYDCQQSSSRKG